VKRVEKKRKFIFQAENVRLDCNFVALQGKEEGKGLHCISELVVMMVGRDELVSGKSVSKSELTVGRKYLDTKGQGVRRGIHMRAWW
jgi:hypothetical protein